MFSHLSIGVGNFERALAFYTVLMDSLGNTLRFCDPARPWAGWESPGQARPLLLIGAPEDGRPHVPGNGQMAAFAVATRAGVYRVYRLALENGAVCAGPPGLRPGYHPGYYGAYFRDTEGNKLCVVCHAPG